MRRPEKTEPFAEALLVSIMAAATSTHSKINMCIEDARRVLGNRMIVPDDIADAFEVAAGRASFHAMNLQARMGFAEEREGREAALEAMRKLRDLCRQFDGAETGGGRQ